MMRSVTILLVTVYSLAWIGVSAQGGWYDSVKHVAATQREDTNKVQTLIHLADAYCFSYPDTGFVYGKQAYELSEKLDYDRGRLYSLISINGALYAMGNYNLELDYAFKLLPLSKRMDDVYARGYSFGAVGDSYINLGEFATGLKYYREAFKQGIAAKVPELHRLYSLLVPVFVGLKQYDSALFYAKTGYVMFINSPFFTNNDWDTKWSATNVYTMCGDAFAASKMNDSALYYYRLSLPASEAVNMQYNMLSAYLGLATVFRDQHLNDSAKSYAWKILFQGSSVIYPISKQKAADILTAIYEGEHNPDSSLKYLHMAVRLKDSLYNRERIMAFQSAFFKENEKQRAIEAATAELKSRYQFYFILALLIAAFVVTGIGIRNRKQRQLQKMRNNIADDLHDDIGSTLSSIRIINELAKAKSPEALPLLNSIGENTATIQENMSDIVWAVNPGNDHFENIVLRMNLFATEILDAKKIKLEFSSDESLNNVRLTMKQRKNLYLFFKEAVNNATKYSDAGQIVIRIVRSRHHVELSIEDDGKGFDASQQSAGNGLKSLKKRAEEINASYLIDSRLAEGTRVKMKFKIN
ncbi:sensor histidine kinase [Puia sp.]|uniref:sensor histidine kinase n=1 Tax=Puia sp. TaxID=2045100 RepID=UPI002F3FA5B7